MILKLRVKLNFEIKNKRQLRQLSTINNKKPGEDEEEPLLIEILI